MPVNHVIAISIAKNQASLTPIRTSLYMRLFLHFPTLNRPYEIRKTYVTIGVTDKKACILNWSGETEECQIAKMPIN
ncbi:MAG TPA: hypothetical protein VIZ18_17280 [Ktedonobacteraceae bacterium]